MSLKPEHSLGASLAVMALDYGITTMNMPTLSDTKNSPPHNAAIESARKATIWTQVSVCAALSLLAKDANIFIFGAGFAVALDWYQRHANLVHPGTGQVTMPPEGGPVPGGVQ
jgi:hypothetical protein